MLVIRLINTTRWYSKMTHAIFSHFNWQIFMECVPRLIRKEKVTFQVLTEASMKITLQGCCTIQSGRNWPTFLRCLLPSASFWWWRL
jgi:hypothetical protein